MAPVLHVCLYVHQKLNVQIDNSGILYIEQAFISTTSIVNNFTSDSRQHTYISSRGETIVLVRLN